MAMLSNSLLLGLAAGFLSAVLMTLFETPFWRKYAMGGVVEWQLNELIVSLLLREEYRSGKRLRAALPMHLFHGTIFGGAISMILATILLPVVALTWLVSLLASIFLWLIVPFLSRPLIEANRSIKLTDTGIIVSLAARVVFGLSLGLILQVLLS